MAGGIARARNSPRAKTTKAQTNKLWKKKHRVGVGDIVQFRTPNPNMFGNVGVVMGYMNKHEFLVKTFGGTDSDYKPMWVSVSDREPDQNYVDANGESVGHNLWYYTNWTISVVHRENPKPPKKRKPVQFHEVTHEELPAVLTGEQAIPDGHKVILVPTQNPAATP